MGCHAILQGVCPTQESNTRLMSPALAGGFFITRPLGNSTNDSMYRINKLKGFPGGRSGKESDCQYRRRSRCGFDPSRKDPRRRKWQSTPVFLLVKSQGQRSLAVYTVHGVAESDTAKCTQGYTVQHWEYSQYFIISLNAI